MVRLYRLGGWSEGLKFFLAFNYDKFKNATYNLFLNCWWFFTNPFEKICSSKHGLFPQEFSGWKIPKKIFELPPPVSSELSRSFRRMKSHPALKHHKCWRNHHVSDSLQNSGKLHHHHNIQASQITKNLSCYYKSWGSKHQYSTYTYFTNPIFQTIFWSPFSLTFSILPNRKPPGFRSWNPKGFPQGTWHPISPSLFQERPKQQHQQGLRFSPGHHSGNQPESPATTADRHWRMIAGLVGG